MFCGSVNGSGLKLVGKFAYLGLKRVRSSRSVPYTSTKMSEEYTWEKRAFKSNRKLDYSGATKLRLVFTWCQWCSEPTHSQTCIAKRSTLFFSLEQFYKNNEAQI